MTADIKYSGESLTHQVNRNLLGEGTICKKMRRSE